MRPLGCLHPLLHRASGAVGCTLRRLQRRARLAPHGVALLRDQAELERERRQLLARLPRIRRRALARGRRRADCSIALLLPRGHCGLSLRGARARSIALPPRRGELLPVGLGGFARGGGGGGGGRLLLARLGHGRVELPLQLTRVLPILLARLALVGELELPLRELAPYLPLPLRPLR